MNDDRPLGPMAQDLLDVLDDDPAMHEDGLPREEVRKRLVDETKFNEKSVQKGLEILHDYGYIYIVEGNLRITPR